MRLIYATTILAVGLALTGCQRTTYGGGGPAAEAAPAPLTPAPVGGVQGSQLPPPTAGGQYPPAPGAAAAGAPQQMASLGPNNAPAIKKESLIGRWTVTAGGSSCDIFLALTKWTGGYRAATRNCGGSASNVSAWDVKGNQVVLSDSTGNQLAALSQTGAQGYSGTTTDGQPITLSR
ncbi:MAG: protease inhibitor Inh/omp19 family protein [Pararhizobium sp.]